MFAIKEAAPSIQDKTREAGIREKAGKPSKSTPIRCPWEIPNALSPSGVAVTEIGSYSYP